MLACRQDDIATGGADLSGKLNAGCRGADDHDPAIRQLAGIAVVHWRHADDRSRQIGRESRHSGDIAGPARNDQRAAGPGSLVCCHLVAAVNSANTSYERTGLNRCASETGVALQIVDDLGHAHVAVRIVALIRIAGQSTLPVRRKKAKQVPPFLLPRVGNLAALEQHVVDRVVGQVLAHGESGLAGADNGGRYVPHDTRSFFCCIFFS